MAGPRQAESRKAFAAWERYRDMGPLRNQRRLAREIGRSRSRIIRWSVAYRWVERARVYDEEMHVKHGTPLNRDKAKAELAKQEKWGPDRRLWTYRGRKALAQIGRTYDGDQQVDSAQGEGWSGRKGRSQHAAA